MEKISVIFFLQKFMIYLLINTQELIILQESKNIDNLINVWNFEEFRCELNERSRIINMNSSFLLSWI